MNAEGASVTHQCRWLHRWGLWQEQLLEIQHITKGNVFGYIQERRCERCGKIELRQVYRLG